MIFGAPDGPDPPDGAGAGVGGQVEVMLPWRDDPRTPTDEAHPLDPAYEAAFFKMREKSHHQCRIRILIPCKNDNYF